MHVTPFIFHLIAAVCQLTEKDVKTQPKLTENTFSQEQIVCIYRLSISINNIFYPLHAFHSAQSEITN